MFADTRAERFGRAVLGLVACLTLAEALGARRFVDMGARAAFDSGVVGMFVLPLALSVAGLGRPERSPFRAGLALGLLAPSASLAAIFSAQAEARYVGVAFGALGLMVGWAALRGVRRSEEPAAFRLMITTAGVTALLVGAVATACWWPHHFSMHGQGARVEPTPHIAIALITLRWTLRALSQRRTSALFGIAVAGTCIALAPTLGSHQAGCMSSPGPLEFLIAPVLVAPALLALWIGPVLRFFTRYDGESRA